MFVTGLAVIAACADPPNPPPVPSSTGSTAQWVEWRTPEDPVRGPVVLVVDRPGGAVDRLVADPDVTTFFNDRFHPVFQAARDGEAAVGVTFLDGCGCVLAGPTRPTSPKDLIQLANTVVVRTDAWRCQGRKFERACTQAPQIPGAD